MSNNLVKHRLKEQTTKAVKQEVKHHHVNHFQGPIPPPDLLAGYEAISSGFADRILKMTEDQSTHRYSLETKSIEADIGIRNRMMNERRTGQYMAFIIAVLFACSGVFLIAKGIKVEGLIFGGVGLVPVIYAFIPKKYLSENGENL
jgi:uncharacterized membrane protein